MPKANKSSSPPSATSANVGHESPLWQRADALRGNMDAAEDEHVCANLKELEYGV